MKKQTPFVLLRAECYEELIGHFSLAFCTLDCKQKVKGKYFLLCNLGGRKSHREKRELGFLGFCRKLESEESSALG